MWYDGLFGITARYPIRIWKLAFAFAYWLLAGVAPLIFLLIEFRKAITLAGNESSLGSLCARTYSQLFLYPLVFGPFLAWFVAEPVVYTWRLPEMKAGGRYVAVAILTLAVVAIAHSEFSDGNRAIWEFSPDKLKEVVVNHFVAPEEAGRERFEQELNALAAERRWSWTRYAYMVSFVVQVATLFLTFVTTGLLAVLPSASRNREEYRVAVVHLAAAVIVSLVWLIMRRVFLEEKELIYRSEGIPGADLIASILFAAGVAYSAGTLVHQFGEKVKATIEIVTAVATIAVFFNPKSIQALFGRQATFTSYGLSFVALLLILTPWIITEWFAASASVESSGGPSGKSSKRLKRK
jgi:hypothetical protein